MDRKVWISLAFIIGLTFPVKAQQYILEDKSTVILKGSSTVNTFTCSCESEWPAIRPVVQEQANSIKFSNAGLTIDIKNLDCGNRIMNKDLQETLHADKYPTIAVKLLSVDQAGYDLEADGVWYTMRAQLLLHLNGRDMTYWTDFKARRENQEQMHFTSSLALRMTDFGITPPRPFLGMIVVHDEMKVDLDLSIRQLNQ